MMPVRWLTSRSRTRCSACRSSCAAVLVATNFIVGLSQRTGIINQIRAFMLERGIAVRQGIGFLRTELPTILATRTDALSPRMLRAIEELAGDWRCLDQRIDGLSSEIEALARQDQACSRLMTVPGIGPII